MKKHKQVTKKKKSIQHHAKRLFHATPKFVHGMVVGAFVGTILVTVARADSAAQALSISSARNCDGNAVMYCGALSTSQLQSRYKNKGVAQIYAAAPFDISASDIAATGKTAVAGLVYKNGHVTVKGKVVATRAVTAGRENIKGSKKVTHDGVTFYERAPSVSFAQNTIAAFVVMKNGQFQFAILGSCGNPVHATPVPKPQPKPTPKPKPTPTPTPTPKSPPPTTITTLTSAPASQGITSLPNTGPGAIIFIAILSVIGGYVTHMTHRHIRHRRRLHAAHHHTTRVES
ncbi:MAG TPA: hypothetical protein VGG13_00340 [Candidatus Saccharimonadales bacterium]|jgi:hypothetical protein